MTDKNKKRLLIWEIVVSAIFILAFAFFIIIEAVVPEAAISVWIKSNILDITKIWDTFKSHIPTLFNSLIFIFLVFAVCKILRLIFHTRMVKNNRSKTIFTLLDGFVKYGGAIAIIILVLRAFGVNTAALIASVGVLTLIVGLGAQPLIADIIAGIFIIFENEYNVGEIVSINGFRGTVVEIGIRSTKVEDVAGNIKIINNNDVGDVVNLSRQLSLAVVECDFPYDVPLSLIENLLSKNLEKMKETIPDIVEGPYYKGVSQYKDSNVTIKIVAKCDESNRFQVERDILREYRNILVENNIDIAYPQVVINYPEEKVYKETKKTKSDADVFMDKQREQSAHVDDSENN